MTYFVSCSLQNASYSSCFGGPPENYFIDERHLGVGIALWVKKEEEEEHGVNL